MRKCLIHAIIIVQLLKKYPTCQEIHNNVVVEFLCALVVVIITLVVVIARIVAVAL